MCFAPAPLISVLRKRPLAGPTARSKSSRLSFEKSPRASRTMAPSRAARASYSAKTLVTAVSMTVLLSGGDASSGQQNLALVGNHEAPAAAHEVGDQRSERGRSIRRDVGTRG